MRHVFERAESMIEGQVRRLGRVRLQLMGDLKQGRKSEELKLVKVKIGQNVECTITDVSLEKSLISMLSGARVPGPAADVSDSHFSMYP